MLVMLSLRVLASLAAAQLGRCAALVCSYPLPIILLLVLPSIVLLSGEVHVETCRAYKGARCMMEHALITEMNRYYEARAPWHDQYMSYTNNAELEALLAPIIADIVPYVANQDVVEIACGTGNWTQILATRARSVLATDGSAAMLAHARTKAYPRKNVTFTVADAYTLDAVDRTCSAAFAADWWSHIPKSKIAPFLQKLHEKLGRGASVLFLDMTYQDYPEFTAYRHDAEGNGITKRRLPNGQQFDVIKNFPTEHELRTHVATVAEQMHYVEYATLHRWLFAYTLQ